MSIRGKAIRGAGALLKRNTTLGVGIGHPHGGEEGDIRVQMVDGSPRLYARAGGQWYGISLSDMVSEELFRFDNIELAGKISLRSLERLLPNVCIGVDNPYVGSGNILMGFKAGFQLASSSANGNIYIGSYAGFLVTGGSGNIAIGNNAYMTDADGDGNTCIGSAAGFMLDGTSNYNTCLGYSTGPDGEVDRGIFIGNGAGNNESVFDFSTCIGWLTRTTGEHGIAIGSQVAAGANETVIGRRGVFRFKSKQYVCDIADGEDAKSASTDSTPIKLPAYAIIKSISVVVEQLSNLGTYNVALYHSTDAGAVADDTALGGTPVEVLGAGVTATLSGNSASAVDIALGTSTGVAKQTYYMDEGINVGTVDRYIHVGNAGTSNGNTDPSTDGEINVLVEYIGLD